MSSLKPSLNLIHLPVAEALQFSTQNTLSQYTLGIISFSDPNNASQVASISPSTVSHLQLSAQILEGAEHACELINTNEAVTDTQHLGNIAYRSNDNYLFGIIELPELTENTTQLEGTSDLQRNTEQAYNEIFALMDALGYRYIYRVWNYMANINGMTHSLERYRQFNAGRKEAFARHPELTSNQYPAACALGLANGPLSIAFLLGRDIAPIAIENPRQVSAYEYPEQYGPRTPSFSRATLLKSTTGYTLFISGTASIVGHQTLHIDDVAAQTRETMLNLGTVIEQANKEIDKPLFDLDSMFLRVYVRNAADLPIIKATMQDYLGTVPHATFILADICRQDLLLEIEATGLADSSPTHAVQSSQASVSK